MRVNSGQRRTVIIRGRGQAELDSLLPIFANIVEKNTPNTAEDFIERMLGELRALLPGKTEKTYRNYLTETIGQLFSMFFEEDNTVEMSPLALKLLHDGDQPSFFKVLASRLQFPNPMAKKHKFDQEVADGLNCRPLVIVLDALLVAHENNDQISFDEISFFILNNLESLRGRYSGQTLYEAIQAARTEGQAVPKLSGSFGRQHIKESLSLLVLSNLVLTDSYSYWLNPLELATTKEILHSTAKKPLFRPLDSNEQHDEFQQRWKRFLTDVSTANPLLLSTDVKAVFPGAPQRLVHPKDRLAGDIGREGELLVLDLENKSLEKAFPGEGMQASDFTAKRGIGFDIQSWFHNEQDRLRQLHRIEVKSTLRVTKPELKSKAVPDGFVMTRSEMKAVETYGETYSIFRVYIYNGGYLVHVLRNPLELRGNGSVSFTPDTWSASYSPSDVSNISFVMEVQA